MNGSIAVTWDSATTSEVDWADARLFAPSFLMNEVAAITTAHRTTMNVAIWSERRDMLIAADEVSGPNPL
jgi:hypothetical protein